MCQSKLIGDILKRFKMENCKPIRTPMDANTKLKRPEEKSEEEMKMYPYQQLIGSLLYRN